jgi:hypothetical protein
MTPIDTVYEYAGYKLAGSLHDLFAGVGLPLIIALSGVAWTVHRVAERGSIRDLLLYFLYLTFAAWLLSPTNMAGLPTPRFAAYLGQAADVLQKKAIRRVNERFLTEPFEWERVAARAGFGEILDPALARDAGRFLEECAKPAFARSEPQGTNVFRPGTLPYGPACETRRQEIWTRLRDHAQKERFHRETTDAAARLDPATAGAFTELYLDRIAERALDGPGSPTSEAALVRASLGTYSYFDAAQSTGGLPAALEAASWGGGARLPGAQRTIWGFAADAAVALVAEFAQSLDNRFTARQRYYQVTVYGPHVYGLALLLVVGLFPVAGLFALLPGQWKALVNYLKVFVSVKLWPLGWAALTSFNARRSSLEAFNPPERTSADVFLAVASMYFIVPVLAFLVVHLATSAAAAPFSPVVPPPAGAPAGPAAVARAAAPSART